MLTDEEDKEVIKYIDTFVTCSTNPEDAKKLLIRECGDKDAIASRVVEIASEVNVHKHLALVESITLNAALITQNYLQLELL